MSRSGYTECDGWELIKWRGAVYHGGCLDGFTSAWAAARKLGTLAGRKL